MPASPTVPEVPPESAVAEVGAPAEGTVDGMVMPGDGDSSEGAGIELDTLVPDPLVGPAEPGTTEPGVGEPATVDEQAAATIATRSSARAVAAACRRCWGW